MPSYFALHVGHSVCQITGHHHVIIMEVIFNGVAECLCFIRSLAIVAKQPIYLIVTLNTANWFLWLLVTLRWNVGSSEQSSPQLFVNSAGPNSSASENKEGQNTLFSQHRH